MKENKLGALAFLRNLRNMEKEGVDKNLIKESMLKLDTKRVLPFRFVAAARYAPGLEETIEKLIIEGLTITQLMEKTKKSQSSLYYFAKKYGLTIQRDTEYLKISKLKI